MNLPNKLSVARLLLTPVFVVSVVYHTEANPILANLPLIVFLTAIATDALDGFIARKYNQITSFGILLDPLADKFLLIVSFITLSLATTTLPHLRIPPWVLIIVLTRDLFILIGAAVIYMVFGYVEFKPSMLGKIATVFQMLTILAVLLRLDYSGIVWTLAAFFTVVSGIHYLIRTSGLLHGKAKNI
ncbi:MAG: CDP-diacylglycerol--glycerol-3-phosphate 3-phosphatidyltransferase [Candidatus Omnitrophica bacterium]|nr:CDP-diacylglycerol--glycerol-3-phosphate 3-phosphatidyltransferase [Candidatus Omnitrophota bacterium]